MTWESPNYDCIYFPEDGIGTGLAKLPTKAPRTYDYLVKIISDVFQIQFKS